MRWLRPASLLAALLAFGATAEARAQSYSATQHQSLLALRPSVSLSAGALQYDVAGTGSAPVLAARGELPLSHYFLIEGGLSAARPEQRLRGITTLLTPEAQIQAQLPFAGAWVAPYIGAGLGAAIDERPRTPGAQRELTISAATGVRYWLTEGRGLRAEVRLRRLGPDFGGTAAEWTLGSSWRL
jgi:hypothetical protein